MSACSAGFAHGLSGDCTSVCFLDRRLEALHDCGPDLGRWLRQRPMLLSPHESTMFIGLQNGAAMEHGEKEEPKTDNNTGRRTMRDIVDVPPLKPRNPIALNIPTPSPQTPQTPQPPQTLNPNPKHTPRRAGEASATGWRPSPARSRAPNSLDQEFFLA